MDPIISLYDPADLLPIIEKFELLERNSLLILQEGIKIRIYSQWSMGLLMAIMSILIVTVFVIYFASYGR